MDPCEHQSAQIKIKARRLETAPEFLDDFT